MRTRCHHVSYFLEVPNQVVRAALQRGLPGIVVLVAHCSKEPGYKGMRGPRWGCISPEVGVPFCTFAFLYSHKDAW